MTWQVAFHPDFRGEFDTLAAAVQDEVLGFVELLRVAGPQLRRPHADTLKGSKHANMKELRFSAADGVWRVAYAFDPDRKAILLIAGDKSGVSSTRFYSALLKKADGRFDRHLAEIGGRKENR